MPRSTVSQALTILLIGAAITPGILAAPTPTLGSLSGGQTQGLRIETLETHRVDYADVVPQLEDTVDLTEQEPERDQDGKDSREPKNISILVNLDERVALSKRSPISWGKMKASEDQNEAETIIRRHLEKNAPKYRNLKNEWDALWLNDKVAEAAQKCGLSDDDPQSVGLDEYIQFGWETEILEEEPESVDHPKGLDKFLPFRNLRNKNAAASGST
ncbi:hypothetical protein F5878DRAFT_660849 [Lentinula raphanica]|uniref:Uncharacterized protein n=1 Tax=Lentinula raphanica TaxID=153919 RepID=A0AA38P9K7_9AGAR|nr:hypothetical protein F5878DRAFT_660849 [Lentinula raphanica]